jgi:hypothetical protein
LTDLVCIAHALLQAMDDARRDGGHAHGSERPHADIDHLVQRQPRLLREQL